MIKLRQKASAAGGPATGEKQFPAIRRYLSTAAKQVGTSDTSSCSPRSAWLPAETRLVTAPVPVQFRVNVLCWMSSDLLKRRSQIRIGNMINSDFEIHPIRTLRVVEEPTNIIPAILKRHMWHAPSPSGTLQVTTPSSTVGVMGVKGEITMSMYGPDVKTAAPIRSLFT